MFENPDTKTCTRCGRTRPIDDFYRRASSRDGRQSRCKDCHREVVRRYRAKLRKRNEENPPDLDALKRCGRCGQVKAGREFHRNRSSTDGLHWVCAKCNRHRADGTASYDPEEGRARHYRNYGLTLDDLQQMLEDQDGRCAIMPDGVRRGTRLARGPLSRLGCRPGPPLHQVQHRDRAARG